MSSSVKGMHRSAGRSGSHARYLAWSSHCPRTGDTTAQKDRQDPLFHQADIFAGEWVMPPKYTNQSVGWFQTESRASKEMKEGAQSDQGVVGRTR